MRSQQAEAGLDITELCRQYGVSQATFYRWRSKYGALSRPEKCGHPVRDGRD
ncbi:MAG: transposase [bacterium]|nr:transposase [bacterium]